MWSDMGDLGILIEVMTGSFEILMDLAAVVASEMTWADQEKKPGITSLFSIETKDALLGQYHKDIPGMNSYKICAGISSKLKQQLSVLIVTWTTNSLRPSKAHKSPLQ